jgi:hypothetical protein
MPDTTLTRSWPSADRSRDRILESEAELQASVERCAIHADGSRPVFQRHAHSVMGVVAIALSISTLHALCGPATIRWLVLGLALVALPASVAPAAVNPIKRVATTWGASNISDECLHGFTPALAHVATKPTVIGIVGVLGVIAPREHVLPNVVFSHSRVTMLRQLAAMAFPTDQPQQVVVAKPAFQSASLAPRLPIPFVVHHFSGKQFNAADNTSNINLNFATLRNSHETFLSSEGHLWIEPAGIGVPVRLASLYGKSRISATLFAQTINTGTFEWWSSWGIAGAIVFIGIGVLLWLLKFSLDKATDYYETRKPHIVAKWTAETEKEQAQAKLFQTLTETEPAKVVAQQQTAELLGKVTENQLDTHMLVKEIHHVVKTWKHNEP